jgi:lambda family phage portal protein
MTSLADIKQIIERHTGSKVERAIAKLSPGIANRRFQSTLDRAMAIYHWQGASKVSAEFEKFTTGISDADSAVDWGQRDTLVDRSRDHIRNVPIASAIINRIVDHAIGPNGLTFHPQIDHIALGMDLQQKAAWERKFSEYYKLWSESYECDYTRQLNFPEKTNQTLRSQLEGGDCFSVLTDMVRPGSPFRLKIQTVEGEMVSNPNSEQNSTTLIDGIRKDADGVAQKACFSKYHPGNLRAYSQAQSWVEREIFGSVTGRRNILHHYVQLRPGQTRGIPILGSVTGKLLNLNRYSKAELLAAVLNSYYTLVIKGNKQSTNLNKKSPLSNESGNSTANKIALGSGSIFRIGTNEEIQAFDPKRPSTGYLPFFESLVMEIGAHCGTPKSSVLMAYDKSYSASRGEVILFWVTVLAHRIRIAIGLCQQAAEALLDELVANGKMYAPGYFRNPLIQNAYRGSGYSQWTGPVREAINELQEAKANETAILAATKSRKMITAETSGKDWESAVYNQLLHEHALLVAAGIEEPLPKELKPEDLIEE